MAGKARPRPWVSLDAEFLHRPTVDLLLGTFGPVGPLVFLAIILEVERTPEGRATDVTEISFGPMARLCGCQPDDVAQIIRCLVDLGKVNATSPYPGSGRARSMVVRLLDRPLWTAEPRRSTTPGRGPLKARAATLSQPKPDERIVAALQAGPLSRPDLAAAVGLVVGGSFDARLKRLRDAGVIRSDGGVYSLRPTDPPFLS